MEPRVSIILGNTSDLGVMESAAAGMAAHLLGVIAAMTTLPVIGVPINASLNGLDSLLAIVQMPLGIPVAAVAVNDAQNAGILAVQMMVIGDLHLAVKLMAFKETLKLKIEKANKDLSEIKFKFKPN